MTADPFSSLDRAARHAIAYRRGIAGADRTPTSGYGTIHAQFDGPVPDRGMDSDMIIDTLATLAEPGIRASTAPRFFGWVIGNSHPTGVAADWLTAAWGQNAANVSAAPAASAVEAVAARWLLELLDLPDDSSVGFVTGATVANLVCLAAARSELLRRAGWDVEADGLIGAPPLPVLIGSDAHATVFTALKILGLGARRVVTIDTDDQGRMIPAAVEHAIARLDAPPIVIGQSGQINTGASDPFDAIAPIVQSKRGWLHVDGAFGLWAQASPALRHQTRGVEQADSWATDGHKWLQTPYDSGFAIVRDSQAHRRAMAISASYLPPASADERDPSDYVIELSRRARGFAAWAMIRQLGKEGVAAMVEQCCDIAMHMGDRLGALPGVTLVAPVTLNQAILRFGESDEHTLAVIKAVQEDAVAYIGASQWRGQWVMRISVSSSATTMDDADLTIASVARCWDAVRADAI